MAKGEAVQVPGGVGEEEDVVVEVKSVSKRGVAEREEEGGGAVVGKEKAGSERLRNPSMARVSTVASSHVVQAYCVDPFDVDELV